MVDQHSIDLLRHIPIIRPQPGFDMGALYMQLGSSQGSCQGGVGITIDYHRIRLLRSQSFFHLFEHLSGLKAVAARAYAQVVFRAWYAHILEEHPIHLIVIMLAGMNYYMIYSPLLQLLIHRREFYEIGTSPHY